MINGLYKGFYDKFKFEKEIVMEKYFIVTDKSDYIRKTVEYNKYQLNMIEAFGKFAETINLESKKYVLRPDDEQIMIFEPTENDILNFKDQLKECTEIYSRFYYYGDIQKQWVEYLKTINLKMVKTPKIDLYFNCNCKKSKEFAYTKNTESNVWICGVRYGCNCDIKIPDGWVEMNEDINSEEIAHLKYRFETDIIFQ